jgi:hypothetical protein
MHEWEEGRRWLQTGCTLPICCVAFFFFFLTDTFLF